MSTDIYYRATGGFARRFQSTTSYNHMLMFSNNDFEPREIIFSEFLRKSALWHVVINDIILT